MNKIEPMIILTIIFIIPMFFIFWFFKEKEKEKIESIKRESNEKMVEFYYNIIKKKLDVMHSNGKINDQDYDRVFNQVTKFYYDDEKEKLKQVNSWLNGIETVIAEKVS